MFYSRYSDGEEAQVTICDIYGDGRFGCRTFLYRAGKLQVYYVEITWQEGGVPILSHTSVWDLEEIRLTEKGYFIYTNKIKISHGNLREHYRIKPLAEDCRALTEKYSSCHTVIWGRYILLFVKCRRTAGNGDSGHKEMNNIHKIPIHDIIWLLKENNLFGAFENIFPFINGKDVFE